jgi:hypothetical protein
MTTSRKMRKSRKILRCCTLLLGGNSQAGRPETPRYCEEVPLRGTRLVGTAESETLLSADRFNPKIGAQLRN